MAKNKDQDRQLGINPFEDLVGRVVKLVYKDATYSGGKEITPMDYEGILVGYDQDFIALDHTLEEAKGSIDYHWYYEGRVNLNRTDITKLKEAGSTVDIFLDHIQGRRGIHFAIPFRHPHRSQQS